jgi:hypothetical protein
MAQTRTAATLKRMVQLRMDALDAVQEDGESLFAHDIEWHAPDEAGRNWDMKGYRGTLDHATDVRMLVNRLRREYRLVEGDFNADEGC